MQVWKNPRRLEKGITVESTSSIPPSLITTNNFIWGKPNSRLLIHTVLPTTLIHKRKQSSARGNNREGKTVVLFSQISLEVGDPRGERGEWGKRKGRLHLEALSDLDG
jgi:hypothetical protein